MGRKVVFECTVNDEKLNKTLREACTEEAMNYVRSEVHKAVNDEVKRVIGNFISADNVKSSLHDELRSMVSGWSISYNIKDQVDDAIKNYVNSDEFLKFIRDRVMFVYSQQITKAISKALEEVVASSSRDNK